MNLLSYRAFSTELTKISAGLGDAETRALLAERRGDEYLKGGELKTNETVPGERPIPAGDGLAAKIAANLTMTMTSPRLLKAKKKENSPYQTVRDTGLKALGGAAMGAGTLRLLKDMGGKTMTPHNYRVGAGVGAGLALMDKAYRHRQEIKDTVRRPKTKTAFVQQNTNASFKSPADSLASVSNVGKFQGTRVHQSAAKVPGLLGKSFRIHT